MTADLPRVYFFYGDDEFTIAESIENLKARLGDRTTAGLNISYLDARNLDLAELEEMCSAAPFLAPRRMAIIHDAEKLPGNAEWKERFFDLLERMPQTAALIFTRLTGPDKKSIGKATGSPLHQWINEHPGIGFTRKFLKPQGGDFTRWIVSQCHSMGGEISPDAAFLLATLVDSDTRVAHGELDKLLDYVNRDREISTDDVEALIPFRGSGDVFSLVDSIGSQDLKAAQEHLHRLLVNEDPGYAFAMITRQFRLIIQVREALDEGRDPGASLGHLSFLSRPLSRQAGNFSMETLERIYRDLHRIDLSIKTGEIDFAVALDAFLASFMIPDEASNELSRPA
jgi:DNA polymerase-3 subunit delta